MPFSTPKSAFWAGFRDALPFIVVAGPFAILFGVLATEAGLNVFETLAFSVVVIAGAAQFAALQLMEENAPTIIILASALAVNLRMAMYSASITPHLGAVPFWWRALAAYFLVDQAYALSIAKYEDEPELPLNQKLAYFFGTVAPVCPLWYVFTLVGAVIGKQIPTSWNIEFIMPLAFLAMIGPLLRTPAHMAAAATGLTVSLLAAGLPYNLGLLLGGCAGMVAGARTEVFMEGRAK
ncbi:branched-chain amino acid ABC transporter permease [Aliishimia ponticola]|uniref:Branched-chain amino acid ABC transporter permease n=1 Tax=Aliishimia ponticola TaxID=2499833 RepID=A0A4S4NEB0_9RHOB|nr:AzlC family ABC transporter permease [Aliishimia ponticola]THH34380.1 branched-chain amino acid ABC transporter permease [Aliishimia ponticola]